jgi:ribosomal protein S18 acetylase RimI-like enzyme
MVKVRKASLVDLRPIHDLAWKVFPATYRSILTPEQIDFMMEWMYSIPSLTEQVLREGHRYLVAEREDGRLAGYVSVQPENRTDETTGLPLWHLQKIYVDPDMQGEYLGQTLFEAAFAYVKELQGGPATVHLNVNRHNPALGFYEHMGMVKAGEGDFDIGHGFYMNDYIMAKNTE